MESNIKKIILFSLLIFLLNSCAVTKIGFKNGVKLNNNEKLSYDVSSTILDMRYGEKDRIFLEDDGYIYYIRLVSQTKKGFEMYGVFPILPIPIVYFPWYQKRSCNSDDCKSTFFIVTIIPKNDAENKIVFDENSFYLINKNDKSNIFSSEFKLRKTGRLAHKNGRYHNYIVSDGKVIVDTESLMNSNSAVMEFDILCNNIDNYKFVINKNNSAPIYIDMNYEGIFEFNFAYGP